MLSALILKPAAADPAGAQAREQEPSESAGRSGRPITPDHGDYLMRSAPNGSYVYREPGFSASVAADGTVTFHESNWKPESTTYDILTNGGKGWSNVIANHGKGWDEQFTKPEVWPVPLPDSNRPTLYDLKDYRPDPMRPEIPVAVPIFADPGLRADLTDQYIRLMGNDPYGPQKAAFLASTFDMRMKMAAQFRRATVSAALDDLPRELQEVWGDPRYSVAERSNLIYLMWQDTSADDPDARHARQIIQDFARRNLPPAQAAWFTGPETRGQPGGTELPEIGE